MYDEISHKLLVLRTKFKTPNGIGPMAYYDSSKPPEIFMSHVPFADARHTGYC